MRLAKKGRAEARRRRSRMRTGGHHRRETYCLSPPLPLFHPLPSPSLPSAPSSILRNSSSVTFAHLLPFSDLRRHKFEKRTATAAKEEEEEGEVDSKVAKVGTDGRGRKKRGKIEKGVIGKRKRKRKGER